MVMQGVLLFFQNVWISSGSKIIDVYILCMHLSSRVSMHINIHIYLY